jgi:hypothetical protein
VDELISYMMEQVYAKMFQSGSQVSERETGTVVIKKQGSGENGSRDKKTIGGCC